MKSITIFVASIIMAACASKLNQSQSSLLKDPPQGFTKKLSTGPAQHSSQTISDRCGDGDGPQSYSTLLKAKAKAVIEVDAWADDHKTLLERVVFNYNKQNVLLEVQQAGCSHPGQRFQFFISKKAELKSVNEEVARAFALLDFGQAKGLYNEAHYIKWYKKHYSKNNISKYCKINVAKGSRPRLYCSHSDDAGFNTHEILVEAMGKNKTKVTFNKWTAL